MMTMILRCQMAMKGKLQNDRDNRRKKSSIASAAAQDQKTAMAMRGR